MKAGIAIDTVGTYTDAVVYDFHNGSILSSAKSLTAKEDIKIKIFGIQISLSKVKKSGKQKSKTPSSGWKAYNHW